VANPYAGTRDDGARVRTTAEHLVIPIDPGRTPDPHPN
jgi:hypothetical protein